MAVHVGINWLAELKKHPNGVLVDSSIISDA